MHAMREDTEAWYRYFWPWFLFGLPATVVVAGIITINIAINSADGLVTDDYYKDGLAIHKDASQSATAEELGINGELRYQDTGAITIQLSSAEPLNHGLISLKLEHPTLPNNDQTVQLNHLGDGLYAGKINTLKPTNWKIAIFSEQAKWRINGRMQTPVNGQTVLK